MTSNRPGRKTHLVTKTAGPLIALIVAVLLAGGCTMPERYLFTTDRDLRFSPEIRELEFQEVLFPTGDGHLLYGWYLPGSNSRQVILYFHGTATNLSHLTHILADFKHLDTGMFVFDYRGFGHSRGEPTEAGTYQDARGALNFLRRLGWTRDRIIYFPGCLPFCRGLFRPFTTIVRKSAKSARR
jgi:fermentation-respiration switch protein FrsA (DUF1100 family)